MPFREALSIVDSCLRTDLVGEGELLAEAVRRLGPGTIGCRQVAATANGDTANPFESALRFTWEQVMFESAWVAAVVTDVRDVLLRAGPGPLPEAFPPGGRGRAEAGRGAR